MLRAILQDRDKLTDIRTLSEVTIESKIESELEAKFIAALEKRAAATQGLSWEENVRGGEVLWTLRIANRSWEIRPQVLLGHSDGVRVPCKPDFVFRPADADPTIKPVAVFCDGLAYHALPDSEQGRIADDIQKRQSLVASGHFCVWSVTWKDVEDFEKSPNAISIEPLVGKVRPAKLSQAAASLGLTLDRSLGRQGSVQMLLGYLDEPDQDQWEKLAQTYALTWLSSGPWISPQAGETLEQRIRSEPSHFNPGPLAAGDAYADVLTLHTWQTWLVALVRCGQQAMRTGKVREVRLGLRLFDEHVARAAADFEASWRAFLHAWNLFQFHGNVEVLSSEMLATTRPAEPEASLPVAAERRPPAYPALEESLQELLELATQESRDLIVAVRKAGLSLPELDYELKAGANRCGPEADLAWPDARVAILANRQFDDRSDFESAGWNVFEYPVDEGELVQTIAAGLQSAGSGARL